MSQTDKQITTDPEPIIGWLFTLVLGTMLIVALVALVLGAR